RARARRRRAGRRRRGRLAGGRGGRGRARCAARVRLVAPRGGGRGVRLSFFVLFDVDGTLLLSHDDVYVAANRAALLEVYGIAPDGPDRPGDTAMSHTRRALRLAGMPDEEIDAGMAQWCEAMSAHYAELLAEADTSAWRVAESARDVLVGIERR